MSIKINLREPKGRKLSNILRAIAKYIEEDQGVDFYLNLSFLVDEEGGKE